MVSVSGVDLVTAKLQSTLWKVKKKFNKHNKKRGPAAAAAEQLLLSKNNLKKLKKKENKFKRRNPFYNNNKKNNNSQYTNFRNSSNNKNNIRYKKLNEDSYYLENNVNNPDHQQLNIEFEEVDQPNIFIEEIKAKFECLNPSYSPKPVIDGSHNKRTSAAASSSRLKTTSMTLPTPTLESSQSASTNAQAQNFENARNSISPKPNSSNRNGSINNNNKTKNSPQLPQPKQILYPKELIKTGWKQKHPVGCGFTNLGNTCYMNATLQALFHTPAFVNWLLSDEKHRALCQKNSGSSFLPCLVCAMHWALKNTLTNQHQSFKPLVIYNKLKSICKHFSHGRQEDAHEFLRYLLEAMERSYLVALNALKIDNRSRETTPLGQIFGGYIRTEVTCLSCSNVSTTFQPLAELQLDIRHMTTLDECLKNHFKKERLDNNDYRCEKCRVVGGAMKQFSLEAPPVVLCVQFKRFSLFGMKLTRPIHCPKIINLTKFLHPSANTNNQNLNYRLTSLIKHIGSSPNSGHYTAVCMAANSNMYLFDDSCVSQVQYPTSSSLSDNQFNFFGNAYVVMYELISEDNSASSKLMSTPTSSSNFSKSYTINNKVNTQAHTNQQQQEYNSPISKANNINGNASASPITPFSNLSKLLTTNTIKPSTKPLVNGNINGVKQGSENRPKLHNPFVKTSTSTPISNGNGSQLHYQSTKSTLVNGNSTKQQSMLIKTTACDKLGQTANGFTRLSLAESSPYLKQQLEKDSKRSSSSSLVPYDEGSDSEGTTPESPIPKRVTGQESPTLSNSPMLAKVLTPKSSRSSRSPTPKQEHGSSKSRSPKPKCNGETIPESPLPKLSNKSNSSCEKEHQEVENSPSKYFPIFNKAAKVNSWNGKSVLNESLEHSRKRALEKTREELEDEEFDAMNTKKKKRHESSHSRSPSKSREEERRHSFGHSTDANRTFDKGSESGNKFQSYEDRRKLVDKMTIPAGASVSASKLGNSHQNGRDSDSSSSERKRDQINRNHSNNYVSSNSHRHGGSGPKFQQNNHRNHSGSSFHTHGNNFGNRRFNNNSNSYSRNGHNSNKKWPNGGGSFRHNNNKDFYYNNKRRY